VPVYTKHSKVRLGKHFSVVFPIQYSHNVQLPCFTLKHFVRTLEDISDRKLMGHGIYILCWWC